MSTRIRLQRHGKKRYPYYHIVVADSRVKRDGKKIERLGEYDPNTNPATINLDFDRAIHWLQTGAQPSDTCRAILSYKGVLHKNHLLNGVKKGAFDEAEAERRFAEWLKDKEAKIVNNKESIALKLAEEEKAKLAAEKEVNDKRAAEIMAKNSPVAEAVEAEAGEEAPAAEAAPEEAPAAEAAPAEEAPATEAAPEAPAEEPAPAEEAPAAEAAPTEADDLTKVEGIGPKTAEILAAKNIATFAALAAVSADDVKAILTEQGGTYASMDPTTWPKQADMAAKGQWDELKKWQDELDGGKEVEATADAKAEEE